MSPNALAVADASPAIATGTVLVVDDDHDVRKILATLLGAEGYDVVGLAADGLAGVALALEHEPDVIVLDIQMPGLNGLDVARQLRPRLPYTRIVILSASNDPTLPAQAEAIPVDAFLAKGCRLSELMAAVAGPV